MKKVLLILVVMSSLFGCSEDTFVGSGYSETEFRQVGYFNSVSSEGTFKVTITKGDEQAVTIIADNNIIGKVRTSVVNEKLKLYLEDGNYRNVHLEAYITVPELRGIENDGDGDMFVYNNTNAESFTLFNRGSANIYLEGSSHLSDIKNEGSGHIFGFDMLSENCIVKNEGSGDIEVACESNLDVSIEGSGNIYYKGHPLINVSVSGSGEVINDN